MAQEPKKEEAAVEAPKSKKKLIIIIAVVALLAAGGGGAFYMMQQKEAAAAAAKAKAKHAKHAEGDEAHEEEADTEHDEAAEEDEEEEAPSGGGGHGDAAAGPSFLAFETFTVNLMPDPDEKFLQLDLTVEVKDAALADQMKAQMPTLRNRVLLLLTSKKASDISTPEGKTALSQELLAELKKPFKGKKPLKVKQVLFTSFVIQ